MDLTARTDYGARVNDIKGENSAEKPIRAKTIGNRSSAKERGESESGKEEKEFTSDVLIELPVFEGPLDLLLHLIQQHKLDILNIPVAFVTEKYLTYLNLMKSLAIDVASEYLVMAATLAHIKSKMLLPATPGQEDEASEEELIDPREELVRRLLEYQKYKQAGQQLSEFATLGRDVFSRGMTEEVPEGPAPFAPVNMFALLDAFEGVLKRAKVKIEHEVIFDRISITDRIVEITEKIQQRKKLTFEELLFESVQTHQNEQKINKFEIVITFLALLEMARMRLMHLYQAGPLGTIYLEMSTPSSEEHDNKATEIEESERTIVSNQPHEDGEDGVDDE